MEASGFAVNASAVSCARSDFVTGSDCMAAFLSGAKNTVLALPANALAAACAAAFIRASAGVHEGQHVAMLQFQAESRFGTFPLLFSFSCCCKGVKFVSSIGCSGI